MTGLSPNVPTPGASGAHPSGGLLTEYAGGAVDQVAAWSVEAHLAGCARCRSVVSAAVAPERLAGNRRVLLVRVATDTGPTGRWLARCGVPDHVLRLLAATPALRLSWLLSVLGVLAVVTGETALAAYLSGGPAGPAAPGHGAGQVLLPFVLAAPLLVLAAVAGAFLPVFDPAYRIAVAAPFSSFTLLVVRATCALAAVLVPVVVAALAVPGPGWLPAALLLPSLALSALALAASAVLGPRAAAVTAGAVWAVPVLWLATADTPLLVLHWHGQVACAALLVAAAGLLAARRDRLDLGWTR